MALSFGGGSSWGGLFPSTNTADLSFGGSGVDQQSLWDAAGLSFGTPAGSTGTTAAAQGVNTTQLDGQSGFFDALSGFGTALLSGIGVQPDTGTATAQKASWGGGGRQRGGVQLDQVLVVGLVGAGLYFALKK